MTNLVSPRAVNPAVRAKGTVRPSESPSMASETILASSLNDQFDQVRLRASPLSDVKLGVSCPAFEPCSVDVRDNKGWQASRSGAVGFVCLISGIKLPVFIVAALSSLSVIKMVAGPELFFVR